MKNDSFRLKCGQIYLPLVKGIASALIILIFLIPVSAVCQILPVKALNDTAFYFEKLYLHIDREFYSPGDDVWFKSYLVSGINHKLIPGFKNVYAELIAEDGRVIDQRLLLSINGVSNNDFHLPDTLASGQYTIRAYTKYLRNFGEESLFHQKIVVSRATDLPEPAENSADQNLIDVAFLPEGGSLVMNAANHIAFKAIDKSGKGIPVNGKVVDDTGQEITSFKSTWKGMGKFVLMPQEGEKYTVHIDDHPRFRYRFKDAQTDGINLHYRPNGNQLQFNLTRNMKSNDIRNLTLAASHKGKELFQETVVMNSFQQPVTVYKGLFPLGISKITLFDEQSNILAERLVFVRNADETYLRISSNKTEYQPREKIELQVESLLPPQEDSLFTGLSVAVVNEDYFSRDGKTQTIESYLLLGSELKGAVESPASCFTGEDDCTADEKLDLVMMVNGWRRYYWNDLKNYFGRPLPDWDDTGLTLEGEVRSLWSGKPVSGGTVQLGPFSAQFLILKDTTDASGRFRFDRFFLKDSALIMLNAYNEKGKQNVELVYKPVSLFDSLIPVYRINQVIQNIDQHEGNKQASFSRQLAEREFQLEHGSILLGEVEVIKEYKSGVAVTSSFGFADRGYMLTDTNREEYSDIIKYLEFEVPGIFVDENDYVKIGTSDKPPIFFVDDYVEDFERVKLIPLRDIMKVEIITAKFDFQHTGGVISILTKNGFGKFSHEFVRIIHGRSTPRIRGFRQAREFYSPTYPMSNEDSYEKPDQRPALYWAPYVVPVNHKANVEFHASDMTGRYRVIAEGISAKGTIIFESTLFEVTSVQNTK